jgi:ABC-2 type transport system permease protein/lipopolysaccharide transport system permease protein
MIYPRAAGMSPARQQVDAEASSAEAPPSGMVVLAKSETPLAGTPLEAVTDWRPMPGRMRRAWRDLGAGLVRYWMWWAMALQDIKLRYRGSMLGPFWLTLSMLLLAVGMGTIYSHLFHVDVHSYVPYLTVGLIVWQFILSTTTEACQTFMTTENVIQQVPIPFSIHAYRVVCRNLIVLGHNLLIVPIGIVVLHIPVHREIWEIVPAGLMLALDGVWVCLLLGMLAARFRDVAPIVASGLQMTFFLTPVIWPADQLGIYRWMADINPLYAAIDVLRAPLLGVAPAPYSWPMLTVFTAAGCGVTFLIFARFRNRIAYWV